MAASVESLHGSCCQQKRSDSWLYSWQSTPSSKIVGTHAFTTKFMKPLKMDCAWRDTKWQTNCFTYALQLYRPAALHPRVLAQNISIAHTTQAHDLYTTQASHSAPASRTSFRLTCAVACRWVWLSRQQAAPGTAGQTAASAVAA
eukprot:1156723-Pelagomonas_calceolata.AAC.3